jgi:mono/diheme cytochrome c family protein
MPKGAVCVVGALLASAALAVAQPVLGQSDLQAQGQQLYEQNCAVCHMPDGTGAPPTFPALAGDENLQDLALIVQNIHQGKNNMPPFPNLTAEQIAALATYIRNSWGNAFGEVTTEEVAALLGAIQRTGDQASIWDGVFTAEQVARGEAAYDACTRCHGRRLTGAADDPDMKSTPPLARAAFLRDWDGRNLATLFEYTRTTMPQNNPGSLPDQEYVDIIAYMLSTSQAPAGDTELPPDPAALGRIVIENRSGP